MFGVFAFDLHQLIQVKKNNNKNQSWIHNVKIAWSIQKIPTPTPRIMHKLVFTIALIALQIVWVDFIFLIGLCVSRNVFSILLFISYGNCFDDKCCKIIFFLQVSNQDHVVTRNCSRSKFGLYFILEKINGHGICPISMKLFVRLDYFFNVFIFVSIEHRLTAMEERWRFDLQIKFGKKFECLTSV